MSIQTYLKCKYAYENAGFCILCIDDFKILKIFIKLSKFPTIFHREMSQAPTLPPPHPQSPYDAFSWAKSICDASLTKIQKQTCLTMFNCLFRNWRILLWKSCLYNRS